MTKSLISLYEEHIYYQPNQNDFSKDLWDQIPQKLGDLSDLISKKLKSRIQIDPESLHELKLITTAHLRSYGSFTSQIKERLNDWNDSDPTFEIGHQPLFFGGSSFVFNKISYAIGLSQYLEQEQNMKSYPFLFIGDHDQVQNELTITRLPQFQSYTGLELKFEYGTGYKLATEIFDVELVAI